MGRDAIAVWVSRAAVPRLLPLPRTVTQNPTGRAELRVTHWVGSSAGSRGGPVPLGGACHWLL